LIFSFLFFFLSLALHYASWLGREEIVSILLAAGSDPNQLSYFKSSPKMISHPTVNFNFSDSFISLLFVPIFHFFSKK